MNAARWLATVCFLPLFACSARDGATPAGSDAHSNAPVARTAQAVPEHFASIGRAATDSEVRAWNIDANASGDGLPAGRGSYAAGATLFARQCAVCHGTNGEGLATYPKLISGPRDAFDFASDPKIPKTIGNYWPYATTVYDYIHRAMPLTAPGSLSPDQVYSLVAFLLAENGVIEKTRVVDARSLPRIQMPARSHFVTDDRKGGPIFR